MLDIMLKVVLLFCGWIAIVCLLVIMIRITITAWRYIPQALLGSNNKMEPVEFTAAVTGVISIFIIIIPPLTSYEFQNEIFFTVFIAFCTATGVYAYKKIKEDELKRHDPKLPEK